MEKNMKSEEFAKIFNSEEFGQILIHIESEDGDPALRISIYPNQANMQGMVRFEDSKEAWEALDNLFENKIDLAWAEEYVRENMWEMAEQFYLN